MYGHEFFNIVFVKLHMKYQYQTSTSSSLFLVEKMHISVDGEHNGISKLCRCT